MGNTTHSSGMPAKRAAGEAVAFRDGLLALFPKGGPCSLASTDSEIRRSGSAGANAVIFSAINAHIADPDRGRCSCGTTLRAAQNDPLMYVGGSTTCSCGACD